MSEERAAFIVHPYNAPPVVMRRQPHCAAPWADMADLTSAYTSCVAMRLRSASGKKGTATFQVMMQLGCCCCCSSCRQLKLSTASGCPGSTCTAIRSSRSAGQSRDSQHWRAADERSSGARMYSCSSDLTHSAVRQQVPGLGTFHSSGSDSLSNSFGGIVCTARTQQREGSGAVGTMSWLPQWQLWCRDSNDMIYTPPAKRQLLRSQRWFTDPAFFTAGQIVESHDVLTELRQSIKPHSTAVCAPSVCCSSRSRVSLDHPEAAEADELTGGRYGGTWMVV